MAKKRKAESKTQAAEQTANSWPSALQLVSWFVFSKLQEAPLADIDPEMIEAWYEEASTTPRLSLHASLYREYEEFRQRFVPPQDMKSEDIKSKLSPREVTVLQLLMEGDTNKEISALLKISVETVKEHVANLMRKTGTTDRMKAAVWGIRNGIEYL